MTSYELNGRLPKSLFKSGKGRPDRMERMYRHLMDPNTWTLKEHEERYLEMLKKAFIIICDNPSRREAKRLIMETVMESVSDPRPGNFNRVSGIQVMQDAENLFGRFEYINKRVQRGIIRDRISLRLQKLYQEAEEGEANDKFIAKYEELLIKLDRLDEIVDEDAMDTSIPEISFTNNPAALLDAEDAEYEEE